MDKCRQLNKRLIGCFLLLGETWFADTGMGTDGSGFGFNLLKCPNLFETMPKGPTVFQRLTIPCNVKICLMSALSSELKFLKKHLREEKE